MLVLHSASVPKCWHVCMRKSSSHVLLHREQRQGASVVEVRVFAAALVEHARHSPCLDKRLVFLPVALHSCHTGPQHGQCQHSTLPTTLAVLRALCGSAPCVGWTTTLLASCGSRGLAAAGRDADHISACHQSTEMHGVSRCRVLPCIPTLPHCVAQQG